MASLFITFEGQEGAGKSTQSKMLYDFLLSRGADVVLTREPGGTKIAEKIRHILKDRENDAIAKQTEALLYVAARAQLVEEVIAPRLAAGGIVLCDRFMDSTIAYQGFGNGIDIEHLTTISNFAARGLVPDLTFLLIVEPEVGLARKAAYKELDRIEAKAIDYHARVKKGYEHLAAKHPGRIAAIDGGLGVEDIHGIIKGRVAELLGCE